MTSLDAFLSPLPLIAVLRGITPEEVDGVADALVEAGFRVIEVPLNSPRAFESIGRLARRLGASCLVGAGTVLDVDDAARVRDAGGKIVVMPHADLAIVTEAKRLGMVCCPGVATPTEAFGALRAGADGLKMFPAEALPPPVVKAWRAVLPKSTLLFAVGGIRPDNLQGYWAAGVSGFGTGSNLYKPGAGVDDVRRVAGEFARAFAELKR